MQSDEHTPVNIGNPVEFTILECAREVLAATGSKSKLAFRPLPEDDPKQRRPDISKAQRILGWEPKIQLAEGLRLTLPWFRANSHDRACGDANEGLNSARRPSVAHDSHQFAHTDDRRHDPTLAASRD